MAKENERSLSLNYEELFRILPERYVVFRANDPDFTFVDANDPENARITKSRDDLIGKGLFDMYPDNSPKYKKTGVSDLAESIRTVIKTKKPNVLTTFRYDVQDETGTFVPKYWRPGHYPLLDKNGNVAYIVATSVDVTAEVLAERKLQESKGDFKDLADSVPQLVWVSDAKGYHEYYNQRWYSYVGTDFKQTKDGGWGSILHPDDQEHAWEAWQHALNTGEAYEAEYRLRHAKTGQYHWFVGRARPARDENGKIVRWYGTCTDIDDQKRATEVQAFLSAATKTLASSLDYKENLRQVANMLVPNIADWCSIVLLENGEREDIALLHKDPKKISLARQLQRLSKGKRDDSFSRILRTGQPEYIPEITDEMIRQIDLSKEEYDIVLRLGLRSSIAMPLRNGSQVIGMITLIQGDKKRNFTPDDLATTGELADRASMAITNASLYQRAQEELVRREELEAQLLLANEQLEARVQRRTEQLQATNENLERSNRELQDFAYVASHDLQEPLRKIQAFGNLLQDEYGSVLGEGDEYVKRIRNAAARMSTLIEDLLSFSRVTTKAKPFANVDLDVIANEVLSDLETRVADTGAEVTVTDLPTVVADPLQMRQLIQNLISNAIKFARPGVTPKVKIYAKAHRRGGRIDKHTLYVEDNGIGFEEKYLDRIFAVFQRLHNKDEYQGTGIGLAICRKIVERHGGTITANSAPGKGTKFIVTFPVNSKEIKA